MTSEGVNSDVRGVNSDVRGVNSDVKGVNSDVRGVNSDVRGVPCLKTGHGTRRPNSRSTRRGPFYA